MEDRADCEGRRAKQAQRSEPVLREPTGSSSLVCSQGASKRIGSHSSLEAGCGQLGANLELVAGPASQSTPDLSASAAAAAAAARLISLNSD